MFDKLRNLSIGRKKNTIFSDIICAFNGVKFILSLFFNHATAYFKYLLINKNSFKNAPTTRHQWSLLAENGAEMKPSSSSLSDDLPYLDTTYQHVVTNRLPIFTEFKSLRGTHLSEIYDSTLPPPPGRGIS